MLHYRNNILHIEQTSIVDIADKFGTPCYAYSKQAIVEAVANYHQAFKNTYKQNFLLCYAVKANSNIHILKLLAQLNCGFDIVSVGELERVIAAGGDTSKVVFSGIGKENHEIKKALEVGILCFNVESMQELDIINNIAKESNKIANISIRINPNIDAKTHPYIATGLKESKFGIDVKQAKYAYQLAKKLPNLKITGIDCHIGSQITEITPYKDMLDSLVNFIDQLQADDIKISHIDIGGGIGIRYKDEKTISILQLAKVAQEKLGKYPDVQLIVEPGRSIVGNAGALLSQAILAKKNYDKNFIVIDAAMNDLIRPSLYNAEHKIWHSQLSPEAQKKCISLVGGVCETGDCFLSDKELSIGKNDLIAIGSAGAYGFTMASNYNSRPRPAEILIDGETMHCIRKKETISEMLAPELSCKFDV